MRHFGRGLKSCQTPGKSLSDCRLIKHCLINSLGAIVSESSLKASPFNIVITGRAARMSTHDRHSRIRCLEAVLLCDRIEIGRGNVSTHVESPEPEGLQTSMPL